MNEKEILNELKKFLKKTDIDLDQSLRNLGIDSLDLLDLILEAEEKFNISIGDDELLSLETVNDIVKVIKDKL